MFTRRSLIAGTGALAGAGLVPSLAAAQAVSPHTLDDFFKPAFARDSALSPDGGRIALLHSVGEGETRKVFVDTLDAANPEKRLARTGFGAFDAFYVEWASEDRLLVWIDMPWEKEIAPPVGSRVAGGGTIKATLRRVMAVGAGGSKPVVLFNDRRMQSYNVNLGNVVDVLPEDPDNIMMSAWDASVGVLALYKVNVHTGEPTLMERGGSSTAAWLTAKGVPVLRIDWNSRGTVQHIYSRAPGEKTWKLVRKTRIDQQPDFFYVGPTDDPMVILAGVRIESEDTVTVRKMDLRTLEFGEKVSARAGGDVVAGLVDERQRYLGAKYHDDRVVYDFVDPAMGKHFAGMNAFFGNECNVSLIDVDAGQNRFLAYVEGARDPGAFFYYDKAARRFEMLGARYPGLQAERLAKTAPVKIRTRDRATLTAYLTAPPSGAGGPLVVLPHGGPEVRDTLGWDRQVQVLAAQGWWVLQPNFRGSGGYGAAFAKAGWRRWGDRMQEDIEDAVAQVIAENKLDAGRVAIMGASYGGYAALMGAVRRPDLYKAAIAICGVSDLPEMLEYERSDDDTPDKEIYRFWVDRIGDPKTDAAMLATASPRRRATEIRCPVLLVHGEDDAIVPVKQSRIMADALKKAGVSFELVEVPDAGHGDWKDEVEKDLMGRYVALLQKAFRA